MCKTNDEFPLLIEEMVVEMKKKLQLQPGQQLKVTVHSDNDKVMICKSTREKLTALGVMDHRASPYNPRTNQYAERAGGVLLHMLRARLVDGHFPLKFWSVLVHGCAWTWNRLVRPSGSAPIELFERKPVNFSNMHIPGVLVYWHLDKRLCVNKKLGPTAGVGVYIGPEIGRAHV